MVDHRSSINMAKNKKSENRLLGLDGFPLATMVFDGHTLAVTCMNTLWKTILHLQTLKSVSQLTMVVQLTRLIEQIKQLHDPPIDRLPQTERSDIQIVFENQIAFEAEWVMRRQSHTPDQIAVFLIPNLASQVDSLFDHFNHVSEDKLAETVMSSNAPKTNPDTHSMVQMVEHFFGATPSRFFLLDIKGRFLVASESYLTAHQTSADNMTGQSLSDMYDADIAFRLKNALKTTDNGK